MTALWAFSVRLYMQTSMHLCHTSGSHSAYLRSHRLTIHIQHRGIQCGTRRISVTCPPSLRNGMKFLKAPRTSAPRNVVVAEYGSWCTPEKSKQDDKIPLTFNKFVNANNATNMPEISKNHELQWHMLAVQILKFHNVAEHLIRSSPIQHKKCSYVWRLYSKSSMVRKKNVSMVSFSKQNCLVTFTSTSSQIQR